VFQPVIRRRAALFAVAVVSVAALASCASLTSAPRVGFFVTSEGVGRGGDLGGLQGADDHCQLLAAAAGHGGRTWRAYLSTSGAFAQPPMPEVAPVNARDRIGKGPWYNVKGELVARNVDELHGQNNLTKATALDERGNTVKGRGDVPNMHDILTGSRLDGTAFAPQTDTTCQGWTSSEEGSAVVGHHDRTGIMRAAWGASWNSSHQSAGCGQDALRRTGGAGLFYCFAAD
jgi:hypothetical protein